MSAPDLRDPAAWPPGTVTIRNQESAAIKLQPTPSIDPNDPLNWSTLRKTTNFSLVCLYTIATFVLLDVGAVIWTPVNLELGISYENLNNAYASNTGGLALGCILLVPLAIKYGRRPVYILSAAVQFASAIWQAKIQTTGEMIAISVLCGVAGAISEAIVQMTVADLFFVHQRGTMNAIYLCCVVVGANLAPVAAGYIAVDQGWRWVWWWTSILLGLSFIGFVFFFEESKFVFSPLRQQLHTPRQKEQTPMPSRHASKEELPLSEQVSKVQSVAEVPSIPKKSYRQRLALVTKSDTPLLPRMYQPFIILVTFPAVAYTALQYGSILAWLSIMITTVSTYLSQPPYNFAPSGIGLFNLPPFIGAILGSLFGGPLSDWYIMRLAKRNGGVYEPEMRLHLALPAVVACPVGILVFGLGLAKIIGDAFVAVVFVRNGVSTIIVFALTPWINRVGLRNMFITAACMNVAIGLLTLPMIFWGKKARVMRAEKYRHLAASQPGGRDA
ncbi:MFS general substrate transporter [Glarea lozoyensis ATCC 20868]|uniref:MFS general substrate transporter n=1 Tax=Glarea lozoyensis (strain ATCC 20868 / MF5171) TaxID=1116229 RepID=S3DQU3_GLAL2|nr:MFS general substrate transporter [Glarea lozoyensis ATCC 20868]EPE34391.1 MFS general substrate transporter [Glarea lozoyensis ATCC 20868]